MRARPRVFVYGFWLVAGLVASTSLVRALVPWPDPLMLRPRYQYFESTKDEYDLLIVGSSRLLRSFDPDVIDARLREHGLQVRSFNFAMNGMRRHETNATLSRVLELEPARLKWVVVEWDFWEADWEFESNIYTDRSVFWHTPGETVAALRGVGLLEQPLIDRLRIARTHLHLLFLNLTSYGMARSILGAWFGLEPKSTPAQRRLTEGLIEKRGFWAHEGAAGRQVADEFASQQDEFRNMAKLLGRLNAASVDLDLHNRYALRRQINQIEQAGARVIYVTGPGCGPTPYAYALRSEGLLPAFLPFNDSVKYPELYAVENHFEWRHLNIRGARIASRLFADAFAELLKREERR